MPRNNFQIYPHHFLPPFAPIQSSNNIPLHDQPSLKFEQQQQSVTVPISSRSKALRPLGIIINNTHPIFNNTIKKGDNDFS